MGEHKTKTVPPVPPSAPMLAKERMVLVIAQNKRTIAAAEKVLEFLNANPESDADFCLLFGIRPIGANQ